MDERISGQTPQQINDEMDTERGERKKEKEKQTIPTCRRPEGSADLEIYLFSFTYNYFYTSNHLPARPAHFSKPPVALNEARGGENEAGSRFQNLH